MNFQIIVRTNMSLLRYLCRKAMTRTTNRPSKTYKLKIEITRLSQKTVVHLSELKIKTIPSRQHPKPKIRVEGREPRPMHASTKTPTSATSEMSTFRELQTKAGMKLRWLPLGSVISMICSRYRRCQNSSARSTMTHNSKESELT